MGAIASLDQLVNTLTGGEAAFESMFYFSDNRIGSGAGAACVAGQCTSLWTFNGYNGQGAAPGGTARNPDNTTLGAIGQSNPTGGRQKYLTCFPAYSNSAGVFSLYDRLADISGLSGTVTTAQNTTSLAVTRYTGTESVGNQIWLEIYTIVGATATTATVSYTNQAGTSGRTSKAVVFGGTGRREATRMIRVPLADGDTGVRSVESVTLAASTVTAGDFGVVIAREIAIGIIATAGVGSMTDLLTQLPSLPEIKTDACLALSFLAVSTTSPNFFTTLSMVEA
jgi:hypothetical protein